MGVFHRWVCCLTGIVAGVLMLLAGCRCKGAELPGGLPAEAAAVIEDYAAGWSRRDAAAIRENFAPDRPGLPGPKFYDEIFAELTAVTLTSTLLAATPEGTDGWRVQVSERRVLQYAGGETLAVTVPVEFVLTRTAAGWKITALRDPA